MEIHLGSNQNRPFIQGFRIISVPNSPGLLEHLNALHLSFYIGPKEMMMLIL
jgi:hypothetical protein